MGLLICRAIVLDFWQNNCDFISTLYHWAVSGILMYIRQYSCISGCAVATFDKRKAKWKMGSGKSVSGVAACFLISITIRCDGYWQSKEHLCPYFTMFLPSNSGGQVPVLTNKDLISMHFADSVITNDSYIVWHNEHNHYVLYMQNTCSPELRL